MKNNPYLLRALYIILVPMVLLIILLNSGWLQRFIPAASINGESFSVVRYNYYYYDYQTTFLHEHEQELDELGYDPDRKAEKQDYDSSMTWKEFFQQEAEAAMAETSYYLALAEQAGYVFTEEELAPVAERVAANAAAGTANGISTKNYYIAYYGPGMTEERYAEELTRVVKAQAYKQYLIDTCQIDQADIEAYLAEHPDLVHTDNDYDAAILNVITLSALPDRATGEVGQAQLEALEAQLNALVERYESGSSFASLQQAFSTCAIGDKQGKLIATRGAELPEALEAHFIDQQNRPGVTIAPTLAFVDTQSGVAYFAVCEGYGENGPGLDAAAVLSAQAIEAQQEQAISAYLPERNSIGMLLAAS